MKNPTRLPIFWTAAAIFLLACPSAAPAAPWNPMINETIDAADAGLRTRRIARSATCPSCETLEAVDIGTTRPINGLWGTSGADIHAVGDGGTLLHYDGQSWTTMNTPASGNLNGIWGASESDVYAVGNQALLHYDGVAWTDALQPPSYPLDTVYALNGVWGSGATNVFAVGANGVILHYDGMEWRSMDSGVSETLYGIWGAAGDNVFAVGRFGTLLHYDGAAWRTMESGVQSSLYSVWGASGTDATAVGWNGAFIHYDGSGWRPSDSNTWRPLYDVWSIGAEGFAAGFDGVILRRRDGAWTEIRFGDAQLNAVWGSAANDVWFMGEGGAAIRYRMASPLVVSGRITDADGNPIPEATVAFSGDAGFAATGADGHFFHEVGPGWTGTVAASKVGWTFEPADREIADISEDAPGRDFTGHTVGDAYVLDFHVQGRVASLMMEPAEYDAWNGHTAGGVEADYRKIANFLYARAEDRFDFIFLISNNEEIPSGVSYFSRYTPVKNDIGGIGNPIYDNTEPYGSAGRLQGMLHFPYRRGLRNGPSLHELAHAWGNSIIDTGEPGHWGFSSAGGQLGGFARDTLVDLGGGIYEANNGKPGATGFGLIANGGNSLPYADIELYLIGLIGPEETPSVLAANNPAWVDAAAGRFSADGLTEYTLDDIIAAHGPRTPSAADARKTFTAIAVVITPRPLAESEWEEVDTYVDHFSYPGDNGIETDYNFWEATGGRATLNMGDIQTAFCDAITLYPDADEDGYGDPTAPVNVCADARGYVPDNTDCDDADPAAYPGQIWYKDMDDDAYSDGTAVTACKRPDGYKAESELAQTDGDCDDADPKRHPDTPFYKDADNDGFGDPKAVAPACEPPEGYVADNTDCDDADPDEFPGQVWYKDADNDGYSDGATDKTSCQRPAGYKPAAELTATSGDCDDGDPDFVANTFYRDADDDNFGDPSVPIAACGRPAGYVADNTDCDDADPAEFPGQTWYKDADNDGYSDGTTATACRRPEGYKIESELSGASIDCDDENASILIDAFYYRDADGDGFGDPQTAVRTCEPPSGYIMDNTDCDDADPDEFPGQIWYKDADNDGYSDGTIDKTSCQRPAGYKLAAELTATSGDCDDGDPDVVANTFYRDADEDGFGDPSVPIAACGQPSGYVANNTDCDDANPAEFPGQTWYKDADNDGYSDGTTATACQRPAGHRLAAELIQMDGDCNDADRAVYTKLYFRDADGDGFGDPDVSAPLCDPGAGYVLNSLDTDDSDPNAPDIPWIPGDVNHDGEIALDDVVSALQIASGIIPYGEVFLEADADGAIGLTDAVYGLQRAAGIAR